MRYWISIVTAILFTGLTSCRESTPANWDVDITLPIINGSLDIKNFTNDSSFDSGPDHLMNIHIKREIAAVLLDSLFKIPDTVITQKYISEFPLSTDFQPGASFPLTPTDLSFNIGDGVKLKQVQVRTGKIKVKFSNTVAQPLQLIYVLPGVKKGAETFSISEIVPTGVNSLEKTYDLAGYSFDLRGANGNAFNTLLQNYTVSIAPNASSVSVQYHQGVELNFSYSDIMPQFAEGYFGTQEITVGPDTTSLSIIKGLKVANFMLNDAVMNFSVTNELGVEFSGYFNNIIGTGSGKTLTLTGNQLNNMNINRAYRNGTTISASQYPVAFNASNSNIVPFISLLPEKVMYGGKITLNPLGNTSGYNDFAFYNTGIRVNSDITIPLKFSADYFELTTTYTTSFGSLSNFDKVNTGHIKIIVTNGFPLEASMQAYMYDANGQVMDSLFAPGFNTAYRAELNTDYSVRAPRISTLYIPVNQQKINNLSNCKSIRLVSRFKPASSPPDIPIFDTYQLKMNIVAELSYNAGL